MAHLETFRHERSFSTAADLSFIEEAVEAIYSVQKALKLAFDEAPRVQDSDGFYFCAFQNLIDRIYEQAEGMLAVAAAGCLAAAETIARTVIEASFNLMFMTHSNREARLFAYFRLYLSEHERKISEWKSTVEKHADESDRNIVLAAIKSRSQLLDGMRSFIEEIASGIGIGQTKQGEWPTSLYKRCETIGRAGDYLTSYHRLSASSHVNAEESIRWLMGMYMLLTTQNKALFESMGLETACYSVMMTRIATQHYLHAAEFVAASFQFNDLTPLIRKHDDIISRAIAAIATDSGCPVELEKLKT